MDRDHKPSCRASRAGPADELRPQHKEAGYVPGTRRSLHSISANVLAPDAEDAHGTSRSDGESRGTNRSSQRGHCPLRGGEVNRSTIQLSTGIPPSGSAATARGWPTGRSPSCAPMRCLRTLETMVPDCAGCETDRCPSHSVEWIGNRRPSRFRHSVVFRSASPAGSGDGGVVTSGGCPSRPTGCTARALRAPRRPTTG